MPEMDLLEKLLDAKFAEQTAKFGEVNVKIGEVGRDVTEVKEMVKEDRAEWKTAIKELYDRTDEQAIKQATLNGASKQHHFHWSQLGYMGSILAGLGTIAYALMR